MQPLTDEQRELAGKHGGLAFWFAERNIGWVHRRFRERDRQDLFEDLVSVAQHALCEAVGAWTRETHCLQALIVHVMGQRLVDYVRKEARRPALEPLPPFEDKACAGTRDAVEGETVARVMTAAARGRLPARQERAFALRLDGADRVEIAATLGVTGRQAENLVGNARRTLMAWAAGGYDF